MYPSIRPIVTIIRYHQLYTRYVCILSLAASLRIMDTYLQDFISWSHNSITNPWMSSFGIFLYTIYCLEYGFTSVVDNYTSICPFSPIFIQKSCIVLYNLRKWIFTYLQRLSKISRKPLFHHFRSISEISAVIFPRFFIWSSISVSYLGQSSFIRL